MTSTRPPRIEVIPAPEGPQRSAGLAAIVGIVCIVGAAIAIILLGRRGPPHERDRDLPRGELAAHEYAAGHARLAAGDAAGAVGALRLATVIEPVFALAHADLAGALLELGDPVGARSEAVAAAAGAGALGPEHQLAIEARLRETTGEWDLAITAYERLCKLAPANVDYRHRLDRARTRQP